MRRVGRGLALLLGVWMMTVPMSWGQDVPDDVPMEGALPDSIVVTATRAAADVRTTGRRVTVWTARDLAALPVTSFDGLLRAVGGVEVQSRGGFGVQSDLTMRGSSFNGVLVLVDGVRLNDPMTGHFLADLPMPLSEIARVEVLRGPAAALYGPDALGGVVQLFTYAGLYDAADLRRGTSATVRAEGGEHSLYGLDAAGQASTARTLVRVATTWQGTDGEPITTPDGTVVQTPDGPLRTDFARQAHTVAAVRALGGATLFARAGLDDRDFGAYHFYTPFASDTAREATRTYWGQARLHGSAAAQTRWQVQLSAKEHEDVYVYNPQTPANRHTSRLLTVQAHAARDLAPGVTVTAGADAHRRSIDSNNLGVHADAAGGAFVQSRWQPTPRLTLNASARLDYDPGFGFEPTPQLHAAYTAGAVTLRAGVGRAVRAPNYIERYFNTTLASPRGRSLGNPDLKAERAWNAEAGADLYTAAGLSLHATAFHRSTANLIDYAKLTPADTVFLARNLLDVQTTGIELDAALDRTTPAGRLRLDASYTWLDADLGEVDAGVDYKYALTNARHLVQGQARLTTGPLTWGVQALWKERLTEERYGVLHARVAYALLQRTRRVTLHAEVRNLFDTAYTDVFDAPLPGRWWLAGLRIDV